MKTMEKEDLIEFFWKSYCKDVGVCVEFLRDFVCLVVNFFFWLKKFSYRGDFFGVSEHHQGLLVLNPISCILAQWSSHLTANMLIQAVPISAP